eukprot:TRINITY_DN91532_c0_g1_i1.p1 TRINITY_DN91532_c0_g1~~TRINITY_DN91532_c0_g1_i1.p1  ORF type:complete len:740 (-),score=140.93 TRINITY_DN91532_c0_g1_i1:191-2410(-)
MPTTASCPTRDLLAVPLEELDEVDRSSRVSDHGPASTAGSVVGDSCGGSTIGADFRTRAVSQLSDSKHSAGTGAQRSALTAPSRYRNSGAFVHGTKFSNFASIMDQGLKAAKCDIFLIDEVRSDGRVPGLDKAPEILIFIDETKARSENMEFDYNASEGTWTTRGIHGVIRPWFFQKVVDQRKGPGRHSLLFQSKQDPLLMANRLRGRHKPRFLVHATYWENVMGILKDGIVPAKNPTSSTRKPFRDLLQGAESHIYTGKVEAVDFLNPGDIARQFSQQSDMEAKRDKEEEEQRAVHFLVEKNHLGLERRPDCIFVIDTAKANLECVQSSERDNSIHVLGKIPAAALVGVAPNEPVNLPENLKASIVDPKSFHDIPVIDLQMDEATLVEQMRHACEVVGFMQVTGHGVSTELQARHMDLQRKFFALPAAIKERLRLNDESPVRGYFGVGGEDLDQVLERQVDEANGANSIKKSRKDYKEAFDMNGVPWSKPVGGYVANIFGLPSRMPEEEELQGFSEVLKEYAAEMFKIARRLLEIMALVLNKPKDFFETYITQPVATHRLLHYWPLKDFATQIGVGEHTDYGLLTLLKQDMVGGLQVLNARDGKWIHCPPIDNAFVVNLGDMLSRWTGHRFKSTVHRVVTTSSCDRYSVPYFLEPNMDTVITYGALCQGPGMQSGSGGASLNFQPPKRQPESLFKEDTAEAILGRFYTASGQLASSKVRGSSQQVGSGNDGGGGEATS